MNTLNELAKALGDDPNFATTITNELTKKVDKTDIGTITVGSGSNSLQVGSGVASGSFSVAVGRTTEASGPHSFAEGWNNDATGDSSHAEGINTLASGKFTHAEGNNTKATAESAHAEGYETIAKGQWSHAEGTKTQANGSAAHAEGDGCIANAARSHAEGQNTQARAVFSHAEGFGTYIPPAAAGQHVQGKYNKQDDEGVYAHIVGNGTSEVRSNAHTLDWDGNAWFAGKVFVGSNQNNATAFGYIGKFTSEETILENLDEIKQTGVYSFEYEMENKIGHCLVIVTTTGFLGDPCVRQVIMTAQGRLSCYARTYTLDYEIGTSPTWSQWKKFSMIDEETENTINQIPNGIIMNTPDKTKQYKVSIDNTGKLITTLIQ